jgi:hypothetical protein
MENVEIIKPQPRTLDQVHGTEYSILAPEERENRAKAKLQERIQRGQRAALGALQRVEREVPQDMLVRARAVQVDGNEVFRMRAAGDDGYPMFHDHALGQIAERLGFPRKYLGDLRGSDWGRALVARNMNELAGHAAEDERFLVRTVDGVVRGVLGRSYRTDDSRPALEGIMEVAREVGAVVADGYAGDTRCSFKILRAEPIEVFPGEWAVFGIDYRTSDYGHGAREAMGFIERLLCLNGASVTTNYRKVHIGGHLDEATFSDRTKKLNAAAAKSAMRDTARALLGTEAIGKLITSVRAANATELDADKALASIRKTVTKAEEKAIVEKYNSPDVELLPPGNTAWRFSNAISWLAGQVDDADRKLDLQQLAGSFVPAVAA